MGIRTKTLEPAIISEMAKLDELVKQGKMERLVHTLYHIKNINGASDGSVKLKNSYSFFSVARGQQDEGIMTSAEETNMEAPNQISSGYSFWGQNLKVAILAAKGDETPFVKPIDKNHLEQFFVNDIGKILSRGVARIEMMNKTLMEITPLLSVPSKISVNVPSIQGDGTFANSSIIMAGEERPIDLWLTGTYQFKVVVDFLTSDITVYNPFRLGLFIDGILYRPRA